MAINIRCQADRINTNALAFLVERVLLALVSAIDPVDIEWTRLISLVMLRIWLDYRGARCYDERFHCSLDAFDNGINSKVIILHNSGIVLVEVCHPRVN